MSVPSEKALVIDDNPAALEATGLMLEALGFEVCLADSVMAALDALERQRFDLAVSDISLPGEVNGVQLAKSLRQRLPHLPVILMTGYSDHFREAANDFTVLRKPFVIGELKSAITVKPR